MFLFLSDLEFFDSCICDLPAWKGVKYKRRKYAKAEIHFELKQKVSPSHILSDHKNNPFFCSCIHQLSNFSMLKCNINCIWWGGQSSNGVLLDLTKMASNLKCIHPPPFWINKHPALSEK